MANKRSSASARFPQSYHLAWLVEHPDRTREWLKRMMLEGFDVHHVDGDHTNNEPGNLVLMEAADHMRLHGMGLRTGIVAWRKRAGFRNRDRRRNTEAMPIAQHVIGLDEESVAAYRSRLGRC